MRSSTVNKKVLYFLGIVLVLMLWQLLSFSIDNAIVMPDPWTVFRETVKLLGSVYTWKCIGYSLYRCLLGFGAAFIIALISGIPSGMSDGIYELLKPMFTLLKTIPTASLVFLFIVLSGARMAPVWITGIVSLPILYEGVAGGIRNVDQSIVEASLVDGSSYFRSALDIRLPLALPYIMVAIASSLSLCFKIEIMSEVITGTTYPGLGSAISTLRRTDPANMVPVFAYSVIAIVIFMIADGLLAKLKDTN